jgi:hypothetical protein
LESGQKSYCSVCRHRKPNKGHTKTTSIILYKKVIFCLCIQNPSCQLIIPAQICSDQPTLSSSLLNKKSTDKKDNKHTNYFSDITIINLMASPPPPTPPTPGASVPDDLPSETALPLTMSASVILSALPTDAATALSRAQEQVAATEGVAGKGKKYFPKSKS